MQPHTAVSMKVVQEKRKSVRDNVKGSLGTTIKAQNPQSLDRIQRLEMAGKMDSELLFIYLVFRRLPFGIDAYAFTLFWMTFVETAVYAYGKTQIFKTSTSLVSITLQY